MRGNSDAAQQPLPNHRHDPPFLRPEIAGDGYRLRALGLAPYIIEVLSSVPHLLLVSLPGNRRP